jgi:hypothetical protein
VDTIVRRPTIARLILRHAAEAEDHPTPGMFPGAEQLLQAAWALFAEGRASGEFNPVNGDPFHAASAVLGATVFYVSAMSSLLPNSGFDPLAPEQVAAHKSAALRTVRMLLGMPPRSTQGPEIAIETRQDSGAQAADARVQPADARVQPADARVQATDGRVQVVRLARE